MQNAQKVKQILGLTLQLHVVCLQKRESGIRLFELFNSLKHFWILQTSPWFVCTFLYFSAFAPVSLRNVLKIALKCFTPSGPFILYF